MKKLIPYIAIIALITIACNGTLNTSGKLLASTAVAVDDGMKGWATYVVINKPPIQQEDAVRNAYNKYQASMLSAKIAYASAAAQPTNASALTVTMDALNASKLSLLGLIATFTSNTIIVTNK